MRSLTSSRENFPVNLVDARATYVGYAQCSPSTTREAVMTSAKYEEKRAFRVVFSFHPFSEQLKNADGAIPSQRTSLLLAMFAFPNWIAISQPSLSLRPTTSMCLVHREPYRTPRRCSPGRAQTAGSRSLPQCDMRVALPPELSQEVKRRRERTPARYRDRLQLEEAAAAAFRYSAAVNDSRLEGRARARQIPFR